MTVALLSKYLASAVTVGLLAAWMMPPTKPKAIAPSPLAGIAPVKPMELPPQTAADQARAAMPPPVAEFSAAPAEASPRISYARTALVPVSYEEQAAAPPVRQTING